MVHVGFQNKKKKKNIHSKNNIPKLWIIAFTFCLPCDKPEPPPTSGNTPVKTNVWPDNECSFAPPWFGFGTRNICLGAVRGMSEK